MAAHSGAISGQDGLLPDEGREGARIFHSGKRGHHGALLVFPEEFGLNMKAKAEASRPHNSLGAAVLVVDLFDAKWQPIPRKLKN